MQLYVVTCISNPIRYQSRYRLYRDFAAHMKASGVQLLTVELAFGERPWEVTEAGNPWHLQLRTNAELWHKENLLNLGIQRLPSDWKYVAWIDADVHFVRPDWAIETCHVLQHHPIAQLWSEAMDMGPDGHCFGQYGSFAANQHIPVRPRIDAKSGEGHYYGGQVPKSGRLGYLHHPGYAWAARRDALDSVGGLFDQGIIGESDWIMARAIFQQASQTFYPGLTTGYKASISAWEARAVKEWRLDLGCVKGTITHAWHGPKGNRNYWHRLQVLVKAKYDPATDLKRDVQGVYDLVDDGSPRFIALRDGLRAYFRNRNEDATSHQG